MALFRDHLLVAPPGTSRVPYFREPMDYCEAQKIALERGGCLLPVQRYSVPNFAPRAVRTLGLIMGKIFA